MPRLQPAISPEPARIDPPAAKSSPLPGPTRLKPAARPAPIISSMDPRVRIVAAAQRAAGRICRRCSIRIRPAITKCPHWVAAINWCCGSRLTTLPRPEPTGDQAALPGNLQRPAPTVLSPVEGAAAEPGKVVRGGQWPDQPWLGVSLGQVLSEGPPPETPEVHKVVDGDSLAVLAARYLGLADRADENLRGQPQRAEQSAVVAHRSGTEASASPAGRRQTSGRRPTGAERLTARSGFLPAPTGSSSRP